MVWVEFSVTSLFVIFFGYKLSEKADRLADLKGLGKGVVGFVLLGFSTSLPELIATVSSTLFLDNPDLGAGNIIGSNNANLFILAFSLLFASTLRKKNGETDIESIVSISFCFLAVSVFFIGLFFKGEPLIGKVSFFSILILIIFSGSIVALKKNNQSEPADTDKMGDPGLFFYILLIFYLLVLVAVSYYLSTVVDRISVITGLRSGSAGAIFLAWATSLPELVVTVSSVILGSSEMGIGNILGSNIFNFSILSIADILSRSGKSLYVPEDEISLLASFQVVILSVLLYMVSCRKLPRWGRLNPLSLLIMLVYGTSILLII